MNTPSKAFVFIFITVLLDCVGLRIIYPVSASIISEVSHSGLRDGVTYNGWLLSLYAFMQFIFAPVIGGLSDRYGRRPVLLISLLGMTFSYLLLMWADSLFLLFVGRLIAGITGSSLTTAYAFTSDISTRENRPKLFGYLSGAVGLGFIIGPFIGGYFSQWGLRTPFLVAAVLSSLNLVFGYFVLPETLRNSKKRAFRILKSNPFTLLVHYFRDPVLSRYFVILSFLFLSAQILPVIWPFYTKLVLNWTDLKIGYSLTFVGLMTALVKMGLVEWFNRSFGELKTIFAGLLLSVTGFIFFAFGHLEWMIYVGVFIFSIGGVASPTLQARISNLANENKQGEIQGVISSILSLINMIAPLIVGELFFYTSNPEANYFPGFSFLLGACFAALGTVFLIRLIKNETK